MFIQRKHLTTTASTNLWAKEELAELEDNTLLLLTSDEQTAGRGRAGKHWISPKGKNIYSTFVFFLDKLTICPGCFSQLASLSIQTFLHQFGVTSCIKWPNDLLVEERKIAGILTEIISTEKPAILIGIGINCNMTKKELLNFDRPVTSILKETKKLWPLDHLRDAFTAIFIKNLFLARENGFETFQKEWLSSVAWMLGTPILHNGIVVTIQHIASDGTLTVTSNEGTYKLYSGDVHCF